MWLKAKIKMTQTQQAELSLTATQYEVLYKDPNMGMAALLQVCAN